MFKLFKRGSSDELPEVEVTVSTNTIIRVLLLVFGAIVFVAALRQASHAIMLILIAFFLTLALNAPVQGISRRLPGKLKGSRTWGTTISFLVVVLFFSSFMAIIVPPLINQTESFISSAPRLIDDLQDEDSQIGGLIERYQLQGQIDDATAQLGENLRNIGGTALSSLGKIGSSVFSLLTVLVLTFMMLLEAPRAVAFARELTPSHRRKHGEELAGAMYKVVKGYINGQVTLAAIAAVVIFPIFFILDISYPIALIFIVFFAGLIPMVGATIGAVIVSLVALTTSVPAALTVLAYYILYQQIENYIIQPRIQANSTNMSPLLVFVAVVIGVSFGGLLGGLFAIPVAGCLKILVLDYLVNHQYISDPEVAIDAKADLKSAKSSSK